MRRIYVFNTETGRMELALETGSAIRVTTDHIGEEETMFFTAEDAEWNG